MKKIEIKLHHTVVAPLLDYLREVGRIISAKGNPSQREMTDLDPDLEEIWSTELKGLWQSDEEAFFALFAKEFIESGTISIDDMNGGAVIRACSAFRLRLRTNDLEAIPDEVLECGECRYESLNAIEKRGYSAYLFLGALQEIALEHLDLLHSEW